MRRSACHRSVLLWLMALGVGACAEAPRQIAGSVRDSAGVTIAEIPESLPVTQLDSLELVLELGTVTGTGPESFRFLVSAVRRDDGSIVLANAGSDEIIAFDSSGEHLWTAGRDGEGPGEFRNIAWLDETAAGSLLVYDRSLRRLSYLGPGGEFGRSIDLHSPVDGRNPAAVGVTGRGNVVLRTQVLATPALPVGSHRLESELYLITRAGDATPVAPLAGEAWAALEAAGRKLLMPQPFTTESRVAVSGDTIAIADPLEPEVRVLTGSSGDVTAIVRLLGAGGPLTLDMIERYGEARVERAAAGGDETRARLERQIVDAITYPGRYPAISSLGIGANGALLALLYPMPWDTVRRWVVVGSGYSASMLELGDRHRLLHFGDTHIVTVWRDELDVEHVRLYRRA